MAETHTQTSRQAHRQAETQTESQTHRQTGRHTDSTPTDRQQETDRHTQTVPNNITCCPIAIVFSMVDFASSSMPRNANSSAEQAYPVRRGSCTGGDSGREANRD